MGRINLGRVVVGGLLAGLLINISEFILNTFVVAQDFEAWSKMKNLPPVEPSQIPIFLILGFLLGIATVWLYAAIRPRFGPGVPTAITAALAVWFMAYAYGTAFLFVMHVLPRKALAISVCWGVVEIIVASIAGAWAYTEA